MDNILNGQTIEQALEVWTIDQWCKRYGIHRLTYQRMRAVGRAPKSVQIGKRRFIRRIDAAEWLQSQKAA